ncbi:MAG: DUF4292 domain-containing protein [Muribaculum sp.]|nr:DUF4292 domain-containing protein [Muribaculum sp.]
MKSKLIVIFLAATALLTGCRSSRTGSVNAGAQPATTTVASSDPFDRLTASFAQWTDVSVPVNIQLVKPSKFSISGRAALVRGKSIDISLRVLGFEMGRAFITGDSAFVVIKPKRTYMAESLSELTKYVTFSTENIQDLLLGRPFVLGNTTMDRDDRKLVEVEALDNGLIIKPKKQPKMAQYGYAADLDELLKKLIVVSSGSEEFKAEVTYSGHARNTPAGVVASDTQIDVETPKGAYEASITWKWGSAKWNSEIVSDFSVPEGYKRVLAKDLLKGALPK